MQDSAGGTEQNQEGAIHVTSWCVVFPLVEKTGIHWLAVITTVLLFLVATVDAHAAGAFSRALRAARSGKLDQAAELWTIVIKRNPKSYAARVNRGSAYLLTGHVLRGIRDWHKANECAPVFAYGLYSTDFIDEAQGNPALLNYAKSLELDPDHVPSVIMIGAFYLDLGLDRMAIELFQFSSDLTRNPMLKNHLSHWVRTLGGDPEK